MKKISYYTLSALFVGSIALSMVSCADDGGCVKIDTSSFLLSLYLVYHINHYLL